LALGKGLINFNKREKVEKKKQQIVGKIIKQPKSYDIMKMLKNIKF
jgi:hypothetical protein